MDFLAEEHGQYSLIKGKAILIEWQRGQNAGATLTPGVGNLWRLGYGLILTESAPLAAR
jgi:hypothetical protein